MSDTPKTPRNVALVAARYEGSGYINSSQYADLEYAAIVDCNYARAEGYRKGIEEAIRTIQESATAIGVTCADDQIRVAIVRLEKMGR